MTGVRAQLKPPAGDQLSAAPARAAQRSARPPVEAAKPGLGAGTRALDAVELPLAATLARAVLLRAPAEVKLLSPGAAAKAVNYYVAQPKRYTPEIVRQIQAVVGVPETGRADEPMAQAVARWQEANGSKDPLLKPDGMAGPRTLPQMFRSGLNVATGAMGFGGEAQTGVIDRWHEFTPDERGIELAKLVNVHLDAAGVPPVVPLVTDTGIAAGQFDGSLWTMELGRKVLSVAQPTLKEATQLVGTVYHEARHAEQTFREVQLRAMQLRTSPGVPDDDKLAKLVAKDVEVPKNIADKGVAAPLVAGSMLALIAQGWWDSDTGPGRGHRERVLTEIEAALPARDRAREELKKHPTPANQAALDRATARLHKAYDAYRDLPEEHDAWATGPLASAAVTRGAPPPPPPAAPAPPGGGGSPVPAPAGV